MDFEGREVYVVFREELKDILRRYEACAVVQLKIGVREAGQPAFSLPGSSDRRGSCRLFLWCPHISLHIWDSLFT